MAKRDSAARRYAEAAFQVAQRDGTVDAWRRELEDAATVVAELDFESLDGGLRASVSAAFLAAYAARVGGLDAARLDLADKLGQLRAGVVIRLLLLFDVGLRQVYDRRGIDIYIQKSSFDSLSGCILNSFNFFSRICNKSACIQLKVVSLDKNRTFITFLDSRCQHAGYVFISRLIGVSHLSAGNLKN